MSDKFYRQKIDVSAPATEGEAVSTFPHTFTNPTRALWVGVMGELIIETIEGESVTFSNFYGLLPFRVAKVLEGTTADSITGMW